MAKQIRFTKKDGEIQYNQNLLNNLENTLNTIMNGNYILLIQKEIKNRTYPQNKLFWLWMSCLSRETGTDAQDIHDYYCMLFLRRTALINGEERVITSGTSKLNTVQFTDFLNKIQADTASEFGIKLPNPDDLHFEAFKAEYEQYINH